MEPPFNCAFQIVVQIAAKPRLVHRGSSAKAGGPLFNALSKFAQANEYRQ
jgi:hypothetical protein